MYFTIAAIVILFILAFLAHASMKYRRDCISNIPGPFCVPLLGAIHYAFGLTPKNIAKKFVHFNNQYGSIFRVWLFHRLFILSSDLELNEQLLSSNIHLSKHRHYNILNIWLGAGLLLSNSTKWYARRKIITPTLHFKILEQFVEVFDQQSTILIDCLEKKANGRDAFNVHPFICSATLAIIAETAMGTKLNAQNDSSLEYTSAVNEMLLLMGWRIMRPQVSNELIFTLLHPFKKMRQTKLINIMHAFTRNVIIERRKALELSLHSTNLGLEDPNDSGIKKHMALLDVLLQAIIDGQPLSDEDIREEVDTFMFAGHDTTAAATSFTLHLLARHPQVQNKLLAEIHQVYGEKQMIPFTLKNLNDLKYMDCVIRETIRLFPPAPNIGREIKEDFKYKHSRLGNGVIPAGTEVVIPIFGLMKDPNRFENPEEYIPERHLNPDAGSSFSFLPFGAGQRNCIGQKFAFFEMKVLLVKILRTYELLPLGEDVEPILSIVMRSCNGMQLGMRKRISK